MFSKIILQFITLYDDDKNFFKSWSLLHICALLNSQIFNMYFIINKFSFLGLTKILSLV